MAAEAGRLFLLKLGTGTNATTIAAQTETSFEINGDAVDMTNKDSAGKKTLLASAGSSQISVSAKGKLTGVANFTTLAGYAEDRTLNDFTLAYDDGSVITGSFQLTKFAASAAEGEVGNYDISLLSSGDWSNA